MSPRESVDPMYIPGRLRTASRPSRTCRWWAVYGIVGFFVVPVVGAIIGFVLAIFVVEYLRSKDTALAWERTKHALVAVLHSMGIELAAGLTIAALFVGGLVAT
jgi:uncharacterized protein YqgC (DUF456 family)